MAGPRPPDANRYGAARQIDVHVQRAAFAVGRLRHRQLGKIGIAIAGVLAAVGVDRLRKIALPVQQADAGQRDAEIARRLAVIAGENTETSRIDRQAFVKSELGAEIGDVIVGAERQRAVLARGEIVIGIVRRKHAVEVGQENRIIRGGVEPPLVDTPEKRLRTVTDRVP